MRKSIRLAQNKDGLHDIGPDDLLSRFSDDILVFILSYLPLKDAALTSKLSRRWRYLWCHRVCLDFEDKERSNKIGEIACYRIASLKKYIDLVFAERNKYINWVNHIIRQRKNPTINDFKICFDLDMNAKGAIDNWIEFAISKNVQRLELDLGDGFLFHNGNYAFPNKIFDGKCESSLKRSFFTDPVRPYATVMEIKFLKALILKRVDVNDEGLKKILSNCPALEHLLVYGSRKLVKAKIHGKGLALKNLEIEYCHGLESIEICDSNIVSFNCIGSYNGVVPITLRLDNVQKLEKIAIRDENTIDNIFRQISCCMSHLQVLEFVVYRLEKNMLQFVPFLKLLKLKQLIMEVEPWDDSCLYVLTSLVEACPNLQRFTIELIGTLKRMVVRQAAKQPHQHLEVVEIGGYIGQTNELELVMYFIENSVALQKLVIKPYMAVGLAAKEMTKVKNVTKNRVQRQLEPNIPVGVELVILL